MSDSNANVSQRVRVALQRAMSRIKELEAQQREPIAVIGMACRFPGGRTVEDFWETLVHRKDMIREVPEQRVLGSWPEGVPRWAGLLDEVDGFDSDFFAISPREALALDPQQRLLLEVAWEALERARLIPGKLAGSKTGVFVGMCSADYRDRTLEGSEVSHDAYATTGNMLSTAAGRISYVLGLQGPALVLDTACSSSLVTVHLACHSLRAGESDLALAGGINLILSERTTNALSHTQALSPDGRCKAFDASANGFVRGEGCGLIVLKRLSDAQRDNDPILGLVVGTAVNQDGRSSGLTAPNMLAQELLLREALAHAELQPDQVGYIECHGTGTSLGDPIEIEAIKSVYGANRNNGSKLWLGAVKTNIGHLEGAAGIAGLIKILLSLRHGSIPPNLHLRRLNPRIKLAGTPLAPITDAVEWPSIEGRRIAGVSSFGMSGTNAHVILEGAPVVDAERPRNPTPAFDLPVLVSGRSEAAMRAQAMRLREHLDAHPDLSIVDLAYSLATTRTHFEARACVSAGQLRAGLDDVAEHGLSASVPVGTAKSSVKLALLFTGQGAQRPGMGAELYEHFAVFRHALDDVCSRLDPLLDAPLREIVFARAGTAEAALLDQTAYTQAGLFALEVALFRLLESLGVEPHVLLGHSVGELAAAHVAGVFSLDDACKLVAARGRLMQALPAGGAMLSVQASEQELAPLLAEHAGVDIAGLNGPMSTVISGDEQPVLEIAARLASRGRKSKRLTVSHAFHSHRMDAMLDDFAKVAASITYAPSRIPIVSNVSGALAGPELCTAAYWVRHVRQAVRFLDGVRTLESLGVSALLELGPHGVLASMASACLSEAGQRSTRIASALRKDRPEATSLVAALGDVHCHGVDVDWAAYFEPFAARPIPLPTYAFQHRRYWLAPRRHGAGDLTSAGLDASRHPLLSAAVSLADADAFLFTTRLSLADHPWLADHVVFDRILLPGTGLLDLALAAGAHVGAPYLDELAIEAPLALAKDQLVTIQLSVGARDEAGRRPISIHSRPASAAVDARWTRHASGSLSAVEARLDFDLSAWPPAGAAELPLDGFYERLAGIGLGYGPTFRGLARAWTLGDARFAEVRLPDSTDVDGFGIHPALLDAALHVLASDADQVALPFSWSGVALLASGAASLRVRLTPTGHDGSFTLDIADEAGRPLASVLSLATRPAAAADLRNALAGGLAQHLYRVEWRPLPRPEPKRLGPVVQLGGAPIAGVTVVDGVDSIEGSPELILIPSFGAEQSPLEASSQLLALLQRCLADVRLAGTRLVVITRRAISTSPDEDVVELAHAPAWGLVRAAQTEHPERHLTLVDVDHIDAALLQALAFDEPQLAVRNATAFVPRLAHASVSTDEPATLDPSGTVLITGAAGALGSLFARHLVDHHGARRLLLVSRSGSDSAAAKQLCATLEAAGAHVTFAACDVADLEQTKRLLASLAPEHPLTAIIHAAGVLDDGVLDSLDRSKLDSVFRPKVDAALNLHELSKHLPLTAFVSCSSVAGTFGSPGQANYAAANAFLDALAAHRRARGLAATSLAWGPWATSGMAARLSEADRARIERSGLPPLSEDEGVALFDATLRASDAVLVPAHLDTNTLAQRDPLPSLLRGLIRTGRPRRTASSSTESSLAQQLAAVESDKRARLLLELVRSEAATVLGQSGAANIPSDQSLQELGLDSLMAVELRNRLQTRTGLRLPATLLFDYPTPTAIADMLLTELLGELQSAPAASPTSTTSDDEPIAIVAMACRYPGNVSTPEQLWQLLIEGRDAITEFPDDRGWPRDLYDPDPSVAGKSVSRRGGFLHDAANFDPTVFGISPREALTVDPQQRLLLETAWEALERAGLPPDRLHGSSTGVFVGIMYNDYASRFGSSPEALDGYIGIGSAPSVASGRISYTFGFEGPAVTVDTACSSSLVTLHLAAQALRIGECDLALAGGATIMATPAAFIEFSRQRGLALDGRCKSFSDKADGVAWGEGVGMLVLERLSDAKRNGHRVLAIVRGSAINQDGRSQGLTAPNGPSQQRVIQAALARARLSAADVDVVEAHGTGTKLGDPIEAQALIATYGRAHDPERPLWLGAIKSNLGHTQAAAGVAGIIKMVLAMQHQTLPPSLHADTPSSQVDWSEQTVRLLVEARPWPRGRVPRRAAVSSFGISGTNAHVILEEASALETAEAPRVEAPPHLPLLFSGKTDAAVREAASRVRELDQPLLDVAYSLVTTRAALERRAVAVVGSLAQLDPEQLVISSARAPKLALLFTGQGAQIPGMGRALSAAYPRFRAALDEIFTHFDGQLETPLRDVMFADAGSARAELLDQTAYTQAALFALEVALFRLFSSYGVTPDFLLGHSIGELTAAHVAGVLSLADACKLVAARGRLMQALPSGGVMLSIQASEAEVRPLLEQHPGVDIAGLNDPHSTVISGDEAAVLAVQSHFTARARKTRRLAVSHAFHSHRMDPMLEDFKKVAESLSFSAPKLPVVSNVTGKLATAAELTSPDYWVRHVRQTVRFLDGARTLEEQGVGLCLELGPHGVLSSMAAACLSNTSQVGFLPALRRDRPETETFAAALGGLHCHGVAIDWNAYYDGLAPRLVDTPTYPFQRQRFWLEASAPAVRPTPCYAVRWNRRPDRAPARPSGAWMVVVPSSLASAELPSSIVAALTTASIQPRVLTISADSSREQISQALKAEYEAARPDVVLSLLALDSRGFEEGSPVGLSLNLALAQALVDAPHPSALWLLTHSAVAVGEHDVVEHPVQATTWGFGLSFALEHPERWGGLLDLPAKCEPATLVRLAGAIAGAEGEDQLALRDDALFARRLIHASLRHAGRRQFTKRGTVLISGGLGSLGAHCARWLARSGVEHLVLTGRRGLDTPNAPALARELEALGARVTVLACDVSLRASVAALFADLEAKQALPTSIIHAAGVLDDGVVSQMSPARFASVLAPKASAALLLHEHSSALKLDNFIVFSSMAGVVGNIGQTNYAAANSFLDALCLHRKSQGLPAISVAWGPWAEAGMAADEAVAQRVRRHGLRPFSPEDGLVALAEALATGESITMVADVDWPRFGQSYAAQRARPLLDELNNSKVAPSLGAQKDEPSETSLVHALASCKIEDRCQLVLKHVLQHVAAVFHIADVGALDGNANLSDLGLDSLMAIELRQRLQRLTDLELPATIAFDHPSPRQLAEHLLDALAPKLTGVTSSNAVAGSDDSTMSTILSWNTQPGRSGASRELASTGVFKLIYDAWTANASPAALALINALIDVRRLEHTTPFDETQAPILLGEATNRADSRSFYCIPSLACPSSPLQFARLVLALKSEGKFWSKGNPGYAPHEPLPESPAALAEFHASAIAGHVREPFILVGYSSGSWISLDVVKHLEARGHAPRGLIFIDPGGAKMAAEEAGTTPQQLELSFIARTAAAFLQGRSAFSEQELLYQITSMASTFRAYRETWVPPRTDIPTLFVHAERGLPLREDPIRWDPRMLWGPYLGNMTIKTVPHDHFEIIADEVEATARAISEWLSETKF